MQQLRGWDLSGLDGRVELFFVCRWFLLLVDRALWVRRLFVLRGKVLGCWSISMYGLCSGALPGKRGPDLVLGVFCGHVWRLGRAFCVHQLSCWQGLCVIGGHSLDCVLSLCDRNLQRCGGLVVQQLRGRDLSGLCGLKLVLNVHFWELLLLLGPRIVYPLQCWSLCRKWCEKLQSVQCRPLLGGRSVSVQPLPRWAAPAAERRTFVRCLQRRLVRKIPLYLVIMLASAPPPYCSNLCTSFFSRCSYCPVGSIDYFSCAVGSFSAAMAPACSACAAGTFQTSSAQSSCSSCPAGYYCPVSGSSAALSCSAGTFSTNGATVCSACSVGQYQANAAQSACVSCDEGAYCASSGLAAPTGTCLEGSYSAAGASACANCASGKYAPQSGLGSCLSCAQGKFQSSTGSSACSLCSSGSYCPSTGLSATVVCASGRYSGSGAASCTSCATGRFSAAGATSCGACLAGTYAAMTGASLCSFCPAGSLCGIGSSVPVSCFSGKYSAAGASACSDCGVGSFVATPGSTSCDPCPSGHYCATVGLSSATAACSAGRYSSVGAASCTACSAGTFASAQAVSCSSCAAGTYSATGASRCTACSLGSYQASSGMPACSDCPAGFFCSSLGLVVPSVCTPGHFSAAAASACSICLAGTFQSSTGASSCTDCSAGHYCATLGLAAVSGECASGTYSSTGATSCSDCAATVRPDVSRPTQARASVARRVHEGPTPLLVPRHARFVRQASTSPMLARSSAWPVHLGSSAHRQVLTHPRRAVPWAALL